MFNSRKEVNVAKQTSIKSSLSQENLLILLFSGNLEKENLAKSFNSLCSLVLTLPPQLRRHRRRRHCQADEPEASSSSGKAGRSGRREGRKERGAARARRRRNRARNRAWTTALLCCECERRCGWKQKWRLLKRKKRSHTRSPEEALPLGWIQFSGAKCDIFGRVEWRF